MTHKKNKKCKLKHQMLLWPTSNAISESEYIKGRKQSRKWNLNNHLVSCYFIIFLPRIVILEKKQN